MNRLNLDQDKKYTLAEVIELVQQALDTVKDKADHSNLEFSSTDIYWLLHDMLVYVNRNVPGEFALRRLEKGTYRVQYRTEEVQKQKASKKLKSEVQQTADYLEELTGRRPKWG